MEKFTMEVSGMLWRCIINSFNPFSNNYTMIEQPIKALMSQGTIGAIFLAVLLIALVLFTTWANRLIQTQLKQKDERIAKLEADVKELEKFNQNELMAIITDTQKLMQRSIDSQERIERFLINFNKI
jgi:hypothetical protein